MTTHSYSDGKKTQGPVDPETPVRTNFDVMNERIEELHGLGSVEAVEAFAAAQPTKQREGDQVLPTVNDTEFVQDRIIAAMIQVAAKTKDEGMVVLADKIIAAMEESKRVGTERYGTPLQTFNGRDTLKDAAEEARDLYVYLTSLQMAREADRERLVGVVTEALEARTAAGAPFGHRVLAEAAVDAILNATGGL